MLDEQPNDMEIFNPIETSAEANAPARVAVSYLRVSTQDQAEKGGQDEGFSIPAQRLANLRKAASLGAVVVEEFVDAGESARKSDRPQLKAMLAYVASNRVDFCIVHKVDRLARNRVDDVEINIALSHAGTRLISASENIDETPSGMLLHGIMSTIAEFYSRNLAAEVTKGMTQKAVTGGTPTRAPLGYKHVRLIDAVGREQRTVEVDDTRAPLIRWAFETYATGEWSLSMLLEELNERGLRTRATRKFEPRPIVSSTLHDLLRNPYYIGKVVYRGVTYEGNHEQFITKEIWDRVQTVLQAHNTAGDRQRAHEHYLKGAVFCGSCGSRLMVNKARSRTGVIYDYFVCIGRHQRRTNCTRRAVSIEEVEKLVERAWRREALSHDERLRAETSLRAALSEHTRNDGVQRAALEAQRDSLLAERSKLLTAHYADAIPLELLKIEQTRIAGSLEIIDDQLTGAQSNFDTIMANIGEVLALLQHVDVAYAKADPHVRRLLNQALAEKIYIDDDSTAEVELDEGVALVRAFANVDLSAVGVKQPLDAPPQGPAQPSKHIHQTKCPRRSSGAFRDQPQLLSADGGWNKAVLVTPTGFEPVLPP